MHFIPAPGVKDAVIEAAEGGVELIVAITEGVPAQDEAWFFNKLKRDFPDVQLLGPNCPGIISPGKANIGITAGHIAKAPVEGKPNVGIVSRSGTLTYQALYELKLNDIGVTTCVGIGGDPVPGTSFIDCLEAFEADDDTKAVMMIGEIGGSAEEEAAAFIADKMSKPVVVLHRRRHRARRQEDGPRRRHRVGRQGHRRRQAGSAPGGRREDRAEPDRGRHAHGRGRQEPLIPASAATPAARGAWHRDRVSTRLRARRGHRAGAWWPLERSSPALVGGPRRRARRPRHDHASTTTTVVTTTTASPSTTTTTVPVAWGALAAGPPRAVVDPHGCGLAVLRDNADGTFVARTPCGEEATVRGTPLRAAHVVLDPGHGGEEPGAVGPAGTLEKDVNLAIAEETQRQLEALGATVVLTRTGDYRITLVARGAIATSLATARLRVDPPQR